MKLVIDNEAVFRKTDNCKGRVLDLNPSQKTLAVDWDDGSIEICPWESVEYKISERKFIINW